MSDTIQSRTFVDADIDQWVEQGIIAPEQAVAIREQIAQAEPPESAQVAPAAREARQGLNMVTIAYYFGSFMILLAYTFYMGINWLSMSYQMQFAVSALTAGLLWSVGAVLRRAGYSMAGGLLIFAGTGITPLLAYTLAQATGIWPQTPDYSDPGYSGFYETIRPYWIYLEVVSLLVAAIAVRLTRFPLITLLIAFWSWYLSMDLARWIGGSTYANYNDLEQIVSILVGLAMLLLAFFLQRRTRQDYSRWLYLFGHVVLLSNLSALTYRYEGILGLLFILTYIAFVVASVWLQRPVFLVFGALGCYGYVSYLAFKTFSGSTGFPIALAIIGLLIVLTAVAYQRYVRTWLEVRLGRYQLHSQKAV